ncbi:MAG: putative T7SS-secreted protein [Actinophytocola sp.]|uniref:putative T7SS-secreted protein n=1 Tax=Actinophytocola sp. TaxID=1872138 RepID=UPI003D6BFA62
MAELGETSDPAALVPGSPDGVDAVAAVFTTRSEDVEATGRELHTFNPSSWVGDASERFREIFAPVPTRWYKTSDALVAAAGALTGYAETLRWTQSQAGEAIALWDEGEAATTAALTTHQTALAEAEAAVRPAPTFSDPGEGTRQEARELLDRARAQLDEAGCDAAQGLGGNGPQGTEVSTFLEDVLVSAASDEAGGGGSWAGNPWEVTGPRGTSSPEDGAGIRIGSISNDADLASTGTDDPNRLEVGAGAEADASVNGSGVHASGNVTVGATGHAELTRDLGGMTITHQVDALAGARAEGNLDVGPTGVDAGAEAFAGGRVEYGGSAEVSGVSAGMNAEGWVGAGASANVDVGYHDGRVVLDLEAGAALGVGGELGGQITIDPQAVSDTIEREADILQRNTDLNPANDDHQNGVLNSLERGWNRLADAF